VDFDRLPIFVGLGMKMDHSIIVCIQLQSSVLKLIVIEIADRFRMGT
jgi:hypothetical protein